MKGNVGARQKVWECLQLENLEYRKRVTTDLRRKEMEVRKERVEK